MIEEFLQQPDVILLLVAFVVFIIIAYKTIKFIAKAFMVALVAACFPIAANFLGFNIEISLYNVFWFAVIGVGLFCLYSIASTGVKILKVITWPFKGLFKKSPKKAKTPKRKKDEEKD